MSSEESERRGRRRDIDDAAWTSGGASIKVDGISDESAAAIDIDDATGSGAGDI